MQIPHEIIVAFVAMLPVVELRGAIPLGLYLGLSPVSTFIWAEIGNMIPLFFILAWLGPVSAYLMKHSKFFHKFFTKIFDTTRQKHSKRFEKMGEIFILILTCIPLPGTGAWTGALLAFLFDVPYWRAILILFIGNIVAGLIISFGFGGALEILKYFK